MSDTSRRKFLKYGLSAALAARVAPGAERQIPRPRTPSPKVIIIGGGLAGLSAGYELTEAGFKVTILEARARPGGRVYTLREPFSDGLHAEAGAARIPDNHHWTLKYTRLFGLELDPFASTRLASLAYLRGQRIEIPPQQDLALSRVRLSLTPEEQKETLTGLAQHYMEPVFDELGDPTAAGWPQATLKEYDEETFAGFLHRRGASAGAIELLELPYYKPADDRISALWWLREAALLQEQKTNYKIRGGNDLLPKAFAARLADNIRYGAAAVRIERERRAVKVVCEQAGTQLKLQADYVICAIPTTLLKRMDISPRFSSDKRAAIERQPYESATRVFLQFRQRFWERDGLSGFAITDLPDDIGQPTHDQPGSRGVLVSYLSGAQSRRVTALRPTDRVTDTIARLEKVYPGVRNYCEGGTAICWDQEEWTRGAYSILQPGQMFSLLPHLASPEGRVHFAGEHTSAWPGWMQGALESGNRVAREITSAVNSEQA